MATWTYTYFTLRGSKDALDALEGIINNTDGTFLLADVLKALELDENLQDYYAEIESIVRENDNSLEIYQSSKWEPMEKVWDAIADKIGGIDVYFCGESENGDFFYKRNSPDNIYPWKYNVSYSEGWECFLDYKKAEEWILDYYNSIDISANNIEELNDILEERDEELVNFYEYVEI